MLRIHHFVYVMLVMSLPAGLWAQESITRSDVAVGPGRWQAVEPQIDASLRGVCVVDANIVWISGAKGSVYRSTDAGHSWKKLNVPNSEAMDFRDVEARDEHHACVMVAGTPARIYCTQDGGETWAVACEDQREGAFFDAMEFWDENHGIAFGDAIDGRLVIATTENGGSTWTIHDADASPEVYAEEHGYAASGSCLAVAGDQVAMIGLGGRSPDESSHCRVLITRDRGQTWNVVETTMKGGETAGIFSVAILNEQRVVAVGGDYMKEDVSDETATYSEDGGKSWNPVESNRPSGYRSAVRPVSRLSDPVLVATGPSGSDYSADLGATWQPLEGEGYHAIDFSADGKLGWAVGSSGRMARWITNPDFESRGD